MESGSTWLQTAILKRRRSGHRTSPMPSQATNHSRYLTWRTDTPHDLHISLPINPRGPVSAATFKPQPLALTVLSAQGTRTGVATPRSGSCWVNRRSCEFRRAGDGCLPVRFALMAGLSSLPTGTNARRRWSGRWPADTQSKADPRESATHSLTRNVVRCYYKCLVGTALGVPSRTDPTATITHSYRQSLNPGQPWRPVLNGLWLRYNSGRPSAPGLWASHWCADAVSAHSSGVTAPYPALGCKGRIWQYGRLSAALCYYSWLV